MRGFFFAVLVVSLLTASAMNSVTGAQTPAQDRLHESLRRELTDKLQASGRFSSIAVANKTTLKAKTLDGAEIAIALDNIAAEVSSKPGQRQEIVAKFVRTIVATVEPQAAPVTRAEFIASLRVIVRTKDYLDQLMAQKANAPPLWRQFAGPALLFVAIDRGERLEIALTGAGKDHDVSDDALFAHGREQLKRFLDDMEVEDASGVRAFTTADAAYSPSLLLLDEPWVKVEKDFGVGFVVAIPDRNTLLAAPAKNAAQLRRAVELVAKSRKTPALFDQLFQRTSSGWAVFSGR